MVAGNDEWEIAVVQSITGEWCAKARLGPPSVNACGIRTHDCFRYTPWMESELEAMRHLNVLIS